MLVSPESLLTALRMFPATEVEVEPLGLRTGSPEYWRLRAAGARRDAVVRRSPDPELAANHLAVMEMLTTSGYPHAPALLGAVGLATIEEQVAGLSPMSVVPGRGELDAAIAALAALHALHTREGLRWECSPHETIPGPDLPLFRLGYSSPERDAARPAIDQVHAALAASPVGFSHGAAAAGHVLCGGGRAWLVNFEQAGLGPQLLDLAAFLLTAGLEAAERRQLALAYAQLRAFETAPTADLVDAGGLLWGLNWLLSIPRRLVENFGDDVASAQIQLEASRIEEGMREPAGDNPAAVAIRRALFGG